MTPQSLDAVVALVPCPFCGWQVTDADVEHLEGTILHPAYRVCCPHCGASTEYTDHDHRKDWNNRVLTLPSDWHPTPEAINALPQPLRDYIHTIQTSHPSYDNAVKVRLLEEKVAMLEAERSILFNVYVPLGNAERETDLMAALECVIEHWHWTIHSENEAAQPEIARTVRWLAEKYGHPEPPQ